MTDQKTFQCPKCHRQLTPSGETTIEGQSAALSIYQCDDCTSEWEFDGERFETAFTFAIDEAGRVLDPESLQPLNLN